MTISAALSSANSSLRAIQTQLAVASSNIANADDVNYSAKTAQQSSRLTSGVGTGVDVTGIVSKVDANLVRSIVAATSTAAAAQTSADYLQGLSDSLGSLSSESSGDTLATTLTSLESALDELATTPESATLKSQVVADLDDGLTSLRTASDSVQTLRANADSAIAASVTSANDLLQEIHGLNQVIINAKAGGESTASLEDQRNAAVKSLAEQMDVGYFVDGEGAMNVYTGSGQVLVGSEVHELSYTASGSVNAATVYPGTLSSISVNGHDITGSFTSGTMAALVELRDSTLPQVQSDLDELAVSLRDTLNAISNDGSAAPPPTSLTGTQSVSASNTLSASGTLRVTVTDADGLVVESQDLDLSTYATVGDLVTALNGIPGLSASIDSSGALTLQATTADNGVAVAGGVMGSGNFSTFFGLNDVVTGSGANDMAVNSALAAASHRFPVGEMATSGTLNVGDLAVSSGSGALAQAMADGMRSADLSATAGTIVADLGTQLASANTRATSTATSLTTLTDSFQSKYGVNVDEETALISELENAYSASAQVLSAVQSMFDDLLQAVR